MAATKEDIKSTSSSSNSTAKSTGTTKRSYINYKRIEMIGNLFSDIANNGLYPNATSSQRAYSYDPVHHPQICYFYFEDSSVGSPSMSISSQPDTQLQDLTDLMFSGSANKFEQLQHRPVDGLWSLSLERSFSVKHPDLEKNTDRYEWEERLDSSVVLILNCNEEKVKKDTRKTLTSQTHIDMKTDHPFVPEDILAVLCPSSLYRVAKEYFGVDKTFSVEEIYKDIKPYIGNAYNIIEYLKGPNYAKKIQNMLSRGQLSKPFALHIVRLPTRRDFFKIPTYRDLLSRDSALATYRTSDFNVAFRRAAAFGLREDIEYFIQFAPLLDIDGQSDSTGMTALHHVVSRKNFSIESKAPLVKALLIAGTEVSIRNNEGVTAEVCAEQNGLNLKDILSKKYEKQLFVAATKQNSDKAVQMFSEADLIGKHYEPRGFDSYVRQRCQDTFLAEESSATSDIPEEQTRVTFRK